jgi:hypothetical protein
MKPGVAGEGTREFGDRVLNTVFAELPQSKRVGFVDHRAIDRFGNGYERNFVARSPGT